MEKTDRIVLGQKLKRLRKKNGMTQEELGEYVGITSQFIMNIERGVSFVPVKHWAKLSKLLGRKLFTEDLVDQYASFVERKLK